MSDYAPFVPEKFSPKTSLPHRKVLLAMISLALAALALGVFGTLPMLRLPASVLVMMSVFAFAQFTYSAATSPNPWDETISVKIYERLERWWERYSRPLRITGYNGQPVYVRDDYNDYREFYDRQGRLIGVEQTTNWSYSDMDWNPGDPEDIMITFTATEKCKHSDRMSWLARRNSPELPAVLTPDQAEHPITSLLDMRSEGYITNLTMKAA